MVRSIVSFPNGKGSEVIDRRHVWVEVVVSYLYLALGGFSPGFPKTNISKVLFDLSYLETPSGSQVFLVVKKESVFCVCG